MSNVARNHGPDRAGVLGPSPSVPPWRRVVVRVLVAVAVGVFVVGVLAIVGLYFALRQWGHRPDLGARPVPAQALADTYDSTLRSGIAVGPVAPRTVVTTGISVQAVTAEAGVGRVYYRATDARRTLCLVDRIDLTATPPTVARTERSCAAALPVEQVTVLRPR